MIEIYALLNIQTHITRASTNSEKLTLKKFVIYFISCFLGSVHEVYYTLTISVFNVFACWVLIGRNHASKLSNTTKLLLLDLFLQEVQVKAFNVLNLFHE